MPPMTMNSAVMAAISMKVLTQLNIVLISEKIILARTPGGRAGRATESVTRCCLDSTPARKFNRSLPKKRAAGAAAVRCPGVFGNRP